MNAPKAARVVVNGAVISDALGPDCALAAARHHVDEWMTEWFGTWEGRVLDVGSDRVIESAEVKSSGACGDEPARLEISVLHRSADWWEDKGVPDEAT